MKNIKKIVALAVMMLVLLSFSLIAVSCGEEVGGTTTTTQGGTTTTTQGGTTTTTQGSTDNSTGTTDSSSQGGSDTLSDNQVKVTVRYENGKAVSGADVQICQGSICFFMPIITGADGTGVGEYDLNGDQLKAKVRSIGNSGDIEYLVPDEEGYIYFDEGSRELVITIKKITVNVIDNNGEGVENAAVKLYQGEHALKTPMYTDADGIAYGYVAISGETLSAVVSEVDGSDDYVLSKTPTEFEDGENVCTIDVQKSNAYVVKLNHLVGGAPLANVKIELYKKGSTVVQKTRYTNEKGIAKFEDVKPGEYSVKVVFESPAYSISRDFDDGEGRYTFAEGSFELSFIINEVPVTYEIKAPDSIIGESLDVYDGNHNYITSITVGEDGKATFVGANSDYIVTYISFATDLYYSPVIFEKDKGAIGEIVESQGTAGLNKETPIVAIGSASCNGTEPVWVAIPFPGNKTITVESYTDGTVSVTLPDESVVEINSTGIIKDVVVDGNMLLLSVDSDYEGAFDVYLTVSAPGTYGSPYDVNELLGDEIDGKELELPATGTDFYYVYTFKADGTITVVVPVTGIYLAVDGVMLDSYTENGKTMISYPAKAGEEVKFNFSGEGLNGAKVSFEVKEIKKNYTATVYLDGEAGKDVVVVLYRVTENGLVEITRVTTDANGVADFGELIYAGDYAVKAITPENYDEQLFESAFEYGDTATIYLNHVKDGSIDYPFNVNTGEGETDTITLDKGQSVWYSVYIMPGHNATLVVNSANVLLTVYWEDTNEDGVVNEADTPCGTSVIVGDKVNYKFADSEKTYMIKVSAIDGEAVSAEYSYVNAVAETGSDVENAKDVLGGFVDAVSISAGQVVYYRYSGDPCKLTVSVTGTDVVLVKINRSLDGDSEEIVDSNCLVIENTAHDMIFFAVKASSDTSYELNVTAESVEAAE